MLRSRYSKAFARKVLRENKANLHWFGRGNNRLWGSRYCAYQPLSSDSAKSTNTEKQSHKLQEDKFDVPEDVGFESFRATIDRAIAEDPHGCLFGRPSHGRRSTGRSSSDPFFWKSRGDCETNDTKSPPESTRTRVVMAKAVTDSPTSSSPVESTTPFTAKNDKSPESEMDYVYDPISMRKVLTKTNRSGPEKNSLVSMLFSEHGVEIPVKTYKPPKVYGYGPSKPPLDGSRSDQLPASSTNSAESSRKQNLRDMMFRTKGNSLDTSARFTEMTDTQPSEETEDQPPPKNKIRESPAPDDSSPLFSGTTYEAKSELNTDPSAKKDDWLVKEGFRDDDPYSKDAKARVDSRETPAKGYAGFHNKHAEHNHVAVEEGLSHGPVKSASPILEPTLDRIQAMPIAEPEHDVHLLQTSLDRHLKQDDALNYELKGSTADKLFRDTIPSTEEDMDLLRASDVRAATRTTRYTKQEAESRKKATRQKMEGTWLALQDDLKGENNDTTKTTTSQGSPHTTESGSLNDVRSHLREYLDGIMAKTMQSMGGLNNSYDTYLQQMRGGKWADLTKKLIFKDESLSKTPSIFTGKPQNPSRPSTPDPEVVQALEERNGRTSSLREATARARGEWEKTRAQLSKLSNDIRAIYEDEYGSINVNHRQSSPSGGLGQPVTSRALDSSGTSNTPPLLNTTVKPGLVTDPVIDAHISTFEPKYAELVDAAKTVRRELHEAKMAIRAIESGRPSNVWAVPSPADSNFGKKRINFKAQAADAPTPEFSVTGDDPIPKPLDKGARADLAGQRSKDETVPEPVFTDSGSPEWNDEQIPPIESLRTREYDAPYLSLVYNHSTGKVIVSPMNEPSQLPNKRADFIEVLGRLKHAPEFLKHFTTLKQAGYSLVDGGEHMLVFTKRSTKHLPPKPLSAENASLNNPEPTKSNQRAATVLEEIPAEIETPGPAAPTAPPSNPSVNTRTRVKRQEDVFSGTLRPSEVAPSAGKATYEEDSLGRRFTRGLRVIFLTIASLSAGAYMIGFVAEGLGAQAQRQNGIAEDSQVSGPRKRIVMTGQRPGIFSTESSR